MKERRSDGLIALVLVLMLAFVVWLLSSCSTNHYFSITSDTMENPSITYSDSIGIIKPW